MKQLLLILALACLLIGCASQETTIVEDHSDDEEQMEEENMEEIPEEESMAESTPDKTFTVTGEDFKFLMDDQEAPELKVNVGDLVRIEFSSTQGFHDWVVDEFDAATDQVRPDDGMTAIEFVADQAGTFEYYCSVGQHRANGMIGNLVVE